MKFKVAEDVDAPIALVFDAMTDFSRIEEDARGRGAELSRVGDWRETAVGVAWRGALPVRGKTRPINAKVIKLEPQDTCVVESRIGGMDCLYEMTFVPLSPDTTRVGVVLDLSANTLSARLLLQTMKLARGRVIQRLQQNLVRQGDEVEAEYRRQQRAGQG